MRIITDNELEVEILKEMERPESVWSPEAGTTIEYKSREYSTQVALHNITGVWFEKDAMASWLDGEWGVTINGVSFYPESGKGKMF